MEITCKRTNTSHLVSGFPNINLRETVHPLFTMPAKQLITLKDNYLSGDWNEAERRVYFVAILASTNLLQFEVAAEPADETVQLNTEFAIKAVNNWSDIGDKVNLPHYNITRENNQLQNVRNWLNEVSDVLNGWRLKYHSSQEREDFLTQETIFNEALSNKSLKNISKYNNILFNWLTQATGLAKEFNTDNVERYRRVFCSTSVIEICNLQTADIDTFWDFITLNLDIDTTYAFQAVRQLADIREKHTKGLGHFIFGDMDEEDAEAAYAKYSRAEKKSFTLVSANAGLDDDSDESDNETDDTQDQQLEAPIPPVASSFAKPGQFLVAKLRYLAAMASYNERMKKSKEQGTINNV